jgi:hypothetical protein
MSGTAAPQENEPRSFTRFVLPFGYTLRPDPDAGSAKASTPRYVADEPPPAERLLYLTGETRQVLFDRAVWLRLEGKDVDFHFKWEIPGGQCTALDLHRKPPRLVLFEHAAAELEGPMNVGFLLLDIVVDRKIAPDSLDSLLHFNELFRYFGEPFRGHALQKDLGVSIREYLAGAEAAVETLGCCTDRLYGGRWESLLSFPLQIKGQVLRLDATIRRSAEHPSPAIHPDNRAFVWTAAVMDQGAGALQDRWTGDLRKPESFGQWIHFLNVDAPKSWPTKTHEARTDFEIEWARKRTYYRWAEFGSWYGFCYHSGAAIIPPECDPPLWQHWSGMYFDQVLLLLYVRTAAFAFSSRLSTISAEARKRGYESRQWLADEFAELRWQFALFTNLYRFPLLSNQQQGLEMYVLARKRMDADELFEEVDEEIRNCDEYLASYTQTKQAKASTVLNLVAMVGLVLGIGLALVQAGLPLPWLRHDPKDLEKWSSFFWGAGLTFVLGVLAIVCWRPLQSATERLVRLSSAGMSKRKGKR